MNNFTKSTDGAAHKNSINMMKLKFVVVKTAPEIISLPTTSMHVRILEHVCSQMCDYMFVHKCVTHKCGLL